MSHCVCLYLCVCVCECVCDERCRADLLDLTWLLHSHFFISSSLISPPFLIGPRDALFILSALYLYLSPHPSFKLFSSPLVLVYTYTHSNVQSRQTDTVRACTFIRLIRFICFSLFSPAAAPFERDKGQQ